MTAMTTSTPARNEAPNAGAWPVQLNRLGTAVFCVVAGLAAATRHRPWSEWSLAVVSLVLFAVGIALTLWAYAAAVERSRTEQISVAGVYFLAGRVVDRRTKVLMNVLFAVQVVVAMAIAIVGSIGLGKDQNNALAFAALAPMFGIGCNGRLAAGFGRFGPRLDRKSQPTHRKIG